MAMLPQTQAAYDKALTSVTLKNGTLVDLKPDIYGWIDPEYEHAWNCKLTTEGTPVEDVWTTFGDTNDPSGVSTHGIVIDQVYCVCGRLKDRRMRWEGSLSAIAGAVFEEAFGGNKDSSSSS